MLIDDDARYVGSVASKGPPQLLKMALDGNQKYEATGAWGLSDGLTGMARIGDIVFLKMYTLLEIRRADNRERVRSMPNLHCLVEKNVPLSDLLNAGNDRAQMKISPMSLAGSEGFVEVTYRDYNEAHSLWPVDDRIDRQIIVTVP